MIFCSIFFTIFYEKSSQQNGTFCNGIRKIVEKRLGRSICRPISPHCSKCPVINYCKRVGVGDKHR